ncbi:hypothetical protein H4R33_006128 [Dimargaris cristalligena]|uniref:Alpha-1,2 mannosyltransferase KTR1 n=1 Tax=Dimargaris cristalligena TaxID=215637 RepID=A0A4Q0A1P9_9FUNG|nr:hypothetical protein H4R33_006128 [Dimargaris cristalligena]RKP40005.1 alpha-1,2 mannosyltransferase KTR1 [Dimargaris cristalligena]|eukprot:RKP40005.1 alpha-1,2 mannosyltransferase KTR1 [Dimargaris cristalligena]
MVGSPRLGHSKWVSLGRCKVFLAIIFTVLIFHLLFVRVGQTPKHLQAYTVQDVLSYNDVRIPPGFNTTAPSVKAAFVSVTRNQDLHELRGAIRQMEDRFNHRYHYPYVFLSDEPFTDEFKETIGWMTPSKVSFGLIPRNHWEVPAFIDRNKMREGMSYLTSKSVIHSDSLSYRQVTRYYAGFFHKHPLVEDYDFYWRLEHDAEYTCDIDYDPFLYMRERNIKYGFTITLHEFLDTVKTLWSTAQQFMTTYTHYTEDKNTMDWVSSDGGNSYNLCHFWSNFEIVDLSFLRSERYERLFRFLDEAGGIFYERWGDAPIRSLAVSMFLKKEDVHWFEDIGYLHSAFQNCPANSATQMKCHCDPDRSIHLNDFSCTRQWNQLSASK